MGRIGEIVELAIECFIIIIAVFMSALLTSFVGDVGASVLTGCIVLLGTLLVLNSLAIISLVSKEFFEDSNEDL